MSQVNEATDESPEINDKKTVVITGSNSGIGLDAATRIAKRGHKVIVACRTLTKAESATEVITKACENEDTDTVPDLIPMELDLCRLDSIASFAKTLEEKVDTIDVLCMNAGMSRNSKAKDVQRTKDGFEVTVGTNHLGHFYLNNLLLPMVRPKTGRIIVTASSVHDPESGGGKGANHAALGDLSGLKNGRNFDMVDGGKFDAMKAYRDSKLCNVLFTRELQRRLDEGNTGVSAYCFSPGLIMSTGFFRDQSPLFVTIFGFVATHLFRINETPHWGGGALEYMALQKNVGLAPGGSYFNSPPGSSKHGEDAYGNQFTIEQPSKEALDVDKAKRLWELSEKLVGIVE